MTEKRPCGSILHKGSENLLLEVAHVTAAHMPLAQVSRLSKFDSKEGRDVASFLRDVTPQGGAH